MVFPADCIVDHNGPSSHRIVNDDAELQKALGEGCTLKPERYAGAPQDPHMDAIVGTGPMNPDDQLIIGDPVVEETMADDAAPSDQVEAFAEMSADSGNRRGNRRGK